MNIKLFKQSNHKSGMPWMRSTCCNERINIQVSRTELEKPIVYGLGLPENERQTITHEARYRCEYGKTEIIFEGTMVNYNSNGCILTEVKP